MSPSIERAELILPGPARAFAALLDLPIPDLVAAQPLPLTWHWFYLLDHPAMADLGRDGHPLQNAIPTPPESGRRRMWVGGRVTMGVGLQSGRPAIRQTSVVRSQEKTGRIGPMTLMTVRSEYQQDGRLRVSDEQEIAYMTGGPWQQRDDTPSPVQSESATVEQNIDWGPGWELDTPPALLFRYSALTYNGHRIHYDRDYAREVEGYPGLVVHGPLQATLMAEVTRRVVGPARPGDVFEYRLVAPAFDTDGIIVSSGIQVANDPVDGAVGGDAARDAPIVHTRVRTRGGRLTATGSYRSVPR